MRQGMGPVAGRVTAAVIGILVVGIVLRLITAILEPVLPPKLMETLNGGWDKLFEIAGPALIPLAGALILGLLIWIIVGRRG